MSKLLAPPFKRMQPVMNSSMSTSPFWSRSSSVSSVFTWSMSSSSVLMKVSTFSSSICRSNSSSVRVPLELVSSSSNTRCMLSTKSAFLSTSVCTRRSWSLCDRCMAVSTNTAVITFSSASMPKVMKARNTTWYSKGMGMSACQISSQSTPLVMAMYKEVVPIVSVPKNLASPSVSWPCPSGPSCTVKEMVPSTKKTEKIMSTAFSKTTLQTKGLMAPVSEQTMMLSSRTYRFARMARVLRMIRSMRTRRSAANLPANTRKSVMLPTAYWCHRATVSITAVATTTMSKMFHSHSLERKNSQRSARMRRTRSVVNMRQNMSPSTLKQISPRTTPGEDALDDTKYARCPVS
mmetsp:Transcript_30206/g.93781  ORF Transcript_30206/g.93781 Transcript_30206/m.93781 type:complete len:349 (-) Transcript_30206:566-1612(-)